MSKDLVTRQSLEKLLDSIPELAPYREVLAARWAGMVMWWHERSVQARRKYFPLRRRGLCRRGPAAADHRRGQRR